MDGLQAALLCLAEPDRQVIVLRHFAELSYAEIGDTLGLAEKTVKSRLHEARQRLGRALQSGACQ
jgi:RNA polymerase sigma factor (sigma-70 family)